MLSSSPIPAISVETPDTVRARPGWDGIAAVKQNRIYPVDGSVFTRPGPRVVDALDQLVALLYPDLK